MKRGFTLIELLVAVLIIGVLTAMALPMYQKSVDKSRYATLMPLAKNIKDAQEAFYLGGGKYSKDLGSLDVRVPGNPSGNTATLSDGTTVEISTTDGYGYVKLSKNNLNNNYIIYQDRSANYPGEIHCEALTDSDRANELCQNLGGQKISGSLTDGYTTYILSGTGAGIAPDINQEAENHGNWQSCDTYPCTKACDRTVKTGYDCNGTYNEDGTYSERVCGGHLCVTTEYDENGKKIKKTAIECNNGSYEESTCDGHYKTWWYDGQENIKGYDNGGGALDFYEYDTDGNMLAHYICSGSYNSAGECTGTPYLYDYYDYENGRLSRGPIQCVGELRADSCSNINTFYQYNYDDAGHLLSKQLCTPDGGDGCFVNNYLEYSYDGDQLISSGFCSYHYADSGDCSYYTEVTYNSDGQMVSSRTCSTRKADGSCEGSWTDEGTYVYEDGLLVGETIDHGYYKEYYNYIYDEDGNVFAKVRCDIDAAGNCTSSPYTYYNCLHSTALGTGDGCY